MSAATARSVELLYLLVKMELKVRYKSTFLGYLWALANPLAFALVYWIAFKFIMRVQMENYSLYLIAGIFPWVWMSAAVTSGTRSFLAKASLIKKSSLPRAVLPLSTVLQETVHFLFALPVILGFVLFAGELPVHASWLWQIPLLMVLQIALAYPLALALAVANVYVRDIESLVGIGFALLFFATPMVYPLAMVPERLRPWFEWNPLHALMQSWRSALLQGQAEAQYMAYVAALASVLGLGAWAFHRRFAPRIGELL